MQVWLLMHWDYAQTGPMGVFDSIEAVFAHYPDTAHEEWRPEGEDNWSQYRRASVRSKEWSYTGYSAELVDVETVETARGKR